MIGGDDFERIAGLVGVVAAGAQTVVFLRRNLHWIYPWLFAFAVLEAGSGAVGHLLPQRTNLYGLYYMATALTGAIVCYGILRELLGFVLEGQPGIERASRKAVHFMLVGGIALGVGLLFANPAPSSARFPILALFFALRQTLHFTLAVALLGVTLFLLRYPLRLRPNVVSYTAGLTVMFVFDAVIMIVLNQLRASAVAPYLNGLDMLVASGCRIYWMLVLKPSGEELNLPPPPSGPDALARSRALLEELQGLNGMLAEPKSRP